LGIWKRLTSLNVEDNRELAQSSSRIEDFLENIEFVGTVSRNFSFILETCPSLTWLALTGYSFSFDSLEILLNTKKLIERQKKLSYVAVSTCFHVTDEALLEASILHGPKIFRNLPYFLEIRCHLPHQSDNITCTYEDYTRMSNMKLSQSSRAWVRVGVLIAVMRANIESAIRNSALDLMHMVMQFIGKQVLSAQHPSLYYDGNDLPFH